MQSRGNLIYKTEKDLRPIPVVMINLNEPMPKADLHDHTLINIQTYSDM